MKLSRPILVLSLACATPYDGLAQTVDLGPDITPRQRFQIYPRIDKAYEAMARGDGQRAISELQQAQRLAPDNTEIALQLAAAHRRFGQPAQAEAVLKAQLQRHPGDARLAQALRDMHQGAVPARQPESQALPAPAAKAPPKTPGTATPSAAPAPEPAKAVSSTADPTPHPRKSPAAQAMPAGYAKASQAYAATERRDFATALPLARQAVAAAPGRLDYQRLLVYLLVENGRFDEAEARATRLDKVKQLQSDSDWQMLRTSIRQRRALRPFEQALQAREQGDMVKALRYAETSVRIAPDALAPRLQWLGLLLQDGQAAQAQRVAEQGLALQNDPALQVLLGVALHAQGRGNASVQAFDAALAAPHLARSERQNYGVIAVDAALAAGQTDRAQRLVQALETDSNADVSSRREQLKALRSPTTSRSYELPLPLVNCFSAGDVPGCEIWPGQEAPDPAYKVAHEAYQAYSDGQYAVAAEKAGAAVQLNPGHLPYRQLRLQALLAAGQKAQALEEVDQTLQLQPDAVEVLALRSRLRHEQGMTEAANADARTALQMGGLSLSSEVDLLLQLGRRDEAAARFAQAVSEPELQQSADPNLAYLAVRVGDDRSALSIFNRARDQSRLPDTALRDGAYAASRLAENEQSIDYFKQAIAAAHEGRLAMTPQQQYETRREVADRDRSWGINTLLGYRGIALGAAGAQPGLYGDVAQLVSEVYWRPQKFGDGRFWELYGGAAQTVYSRHDVPTGGETTQGAVGVRAKPLSDHNLILAAERRVRIGSLSSNDWLLRMGYSGGMGTDLRVDVPSWNTFNMYAEVGRFIHRKQNYATFEAQAGRSFRMGGSDSRLVLFPHAVLGADYNSERTASGKQSSVGAGVGVSMRFWFREDRDHAPRSYLDLSLQYRARLAGDERGKGVFLRAALVF
ncbi:NfrA family protein [Comamonas thiooxydans]|uniref:NfrA family protein n=1 Tax=Comamonas thiooxydans TaxID=363952 RepID=UPI001CC9CBE8|nr:tetratricopeptide repeat protein [Comamonas thiooxydans]MCO8247546.1 tetratricopeptide repeat protein [Comamonas thiooxydans]UBQ42651.1 tetratricopeptide repeat protein [Comamonas thiooxydans]